MSTTIISAVCSILNDDDSLNTEAMQLHMSDQWAGGIGGVLIAGTMGQMQMLPDATYRDLVACAVKASVGRGEIMVGVGDASLGRTRDRMAWCGQFDVDAMVVLTPWMGKHSQSDIADYYRAVADASPKPIYLYDLPALTGNPVDNETVLALMDHPNICGIKSSTVWDQTRRLMDVVNPDFRVIPAQPFLVDQLVVMGVGSNLDGIYSVFPRHTLRIVAAAAAGDMAAARAGQMQLSAALTHMRSLPISAVSASSAILNARGISGKTCCLPVRTPTPTEAADLLAVPVIAEMLQAEGPAGG